MLGVGRGAPASVWGLVSPFAVPALESLGLERDVGPPPPSGVVCGMELVPSPGLCGRPVPGVNAALGRAPREASLAGVSRGAGGVEPPAQRPP